MIRALTSFIAFLTLFNLTDYNSVKNPAIVIAENFIRSIEKNDANSISEILHSDSEIYSSLGGRLTKLTSSQFLENVKHKKFGGKFKTINYSNTTYFGKNTATVLISTINEKFMFIYQFSLAKINKKWMIISLVVEINKE